MARHGLDICPALPGVTPCGDRSLTLELPELEIGGIFDIRFLGDGLPAAHHAIGGRLERGHKAWEQRALTEHVLQHDVDTVGRGAVIGGEPAAAV